jgi:hypothetical protein
MESDNHGTSLEKFVVVVEVVVVDFAVVVVVGVVIT